MTEDQSAEIAQHFFFGWRSGVDARQVVALAAARWPCINPEQVRRGLLIAAELMMAETAFDKSGAAG